MLNQIGHEFNGFYSETKNGFYDYLETGDKDVPATIVKVLLEKAQEPWPDESSKSQGNARSSATPE